MANTAWELDRNDTEGALILAARLVAAGKYTPSVAETLLMLQDDPGELLKGLRGILDQP